MTLKALVNLVSKQQKFYCGSRMSIKKEERITAIIGGKEERITATIRGRRTNYSDNSRTVLNYRCNSFLIVPMIQNTTYYLIG
jgi:hypothetical protein